MEKLSVVIITFNEQRNIGRCIDSVQSVADEVLVIDSFSTDNTRAICLEKKVRFIEHAFAGYGQQKNFGSREATHRYILSLDADEALDPTLVSAILQARAAGFPAAGYIMNRCTNYCGKWIRHGDWYPDRKVRLFNKEKVCWSEDAVHESTIPADGIKFQQLTGDLLHYSYHSLEEHIIQNNRYSTISAELYFRKGKRSGWFKMLANPAWAFIHGYLLRMGFLDGFYGFVIAKNVAHLTFMKYYKLYALQKGIAVSNGR